MKNKRIINYAFLKYYYDVKSDDEIINFNCKQDRIKCVLEIFKNSKLFFNHKEHILFKSFVNEFYENHDLSITSFSEELDDLLGFCIIKILNLIESSEPRDGNLISFNEVLLDIKDKISEVRDNELHGRYVVAFNHLKYVFGEDFPTFDDNLINLSFTDKRSPYYNDSIEKHI